MTDIAFRSIIAKYSKHGEPHGGPDVFWTEFVSCKGLLSPGREHLQKDLAYSDSERPIVAQVFGGDPEYFFECARFIHSLGFDGIDINMGCPDRSVEKQGAGAALIKDPQRAREIIRACKEGAGDMPVSVKTRIGYNRDELDTWLPEILAEEPAVVTIHARTRKEMSKVPARWEAVTRAVAIRDSLGSATLIIGNGDVRDKADARHKADESGADGVMLGRAVFGNPWLFLDTPYVPTTEERLKVMVEHTRLFEKYCRHKNFAVMKKHYTAYVRGFDGAKELRMELMRASGADEVERTVARFLKTRK